MSQNGTVLTIRQRKAIAALLSERNIVAAAAVCKVSKQRIYEWLGQPAFRAELTAAESLAIDEAARRLVRISSWAAEVLEDAMKDPATTANAKIRAAQVCLDSLLRLREFIQLEERVAKLEEAERERSLR